MTKHWVLLSQPTCRRYLLLCTSLISSYAKMLHVLLSWLGPCLAPLGIIGSCILQAAKGKEINKNTARDKFRVQQKLLFSTYEQKGEQYIRIFTSKNILKRLICQLLSTRATSFDEVNFKIPLLLSGPTYQTQCLDLNTFRGPRK